MNCKLMSCNVHDGGRLVNGFDAGSREKGTVSTRPQGLARSLLEECHSRRERASDVSRAGGRSQFFAANEAGSFWVGPAALPPIRSTPS